MTLTNQRRQLMRFINSLLPALTTLGMGAYWLVFIITVLESTAFVGLLIPGTTVLIFVGFLASQGILDVFSLFLMVSGGGIIGDAISFYAGQKGLKKYKLGEKLLNSKHLKAGEEFFRKHGEKSVVLARFVGPLRPIIPFVAGLFKMKTNKFFLYNILSGIVAAIVYLALGYLFGGVWPQIRRTVHIIEVPVIIILVAAGMGWFWRKELFSARG